MTTTTLEPPVSPTNIEVAKQFHARYGDLNRAGWRPRMDWRFGYFSPDEYYEATIAKLVKDDTSWLDVGSGRDLFPTNLVLAKKLSNQCRTLVGLDPDGTLLENPFVHEKVQCSLEQFSTDQKFSLITLRMVAEHIANPAASAEKLASLSQPGSLIVIYTINRWSPLPIATKLIPFRLHHPIKKFLWRTEEKDTFPVFYRMNSRTSLRKVFSQAGFLERDFKYLDDCRTLFRFRVGHCAELACWRGLKAIGIGYPEQCLLGIYERQ